MCDAFTQGLRDFADELEKNDQVELSGPDALRVYANAMNRAIIARDKDE